jgi:signal transduction histidine kinase
VSITQRVKLAQELHDGIAQDLVGLGYGLDALLASELDSSKRQVLRGLRFDTSSLIEKVRVEIFNLRSDSEHLDELNSRPEIPAELSKIFSEIISNVYQHSKATQLEINIRDNGIGGAEEKTNHHGMQGIAERVLEIGGQLQIQSSFSGTEIDIILPMAKL